MIRRLLAVSAVAGFLVLGFASTAQALPTAQVDVKAGPAVHVRGAVNIEDGRVLNTMLGQLIPIANNNG